MPAKKIYPKITLILLSALLIPLTSSSSHAADENTSVSATVPTTSSPTPTPTPAPDSDSPLTPILLDPDDGTVTSDSTPTFVWSKSLDQSDSDLKYTLYLNGVATYLGIGNSGNTLKSNFSSEIEDNQIRLTPSSAIIDGEYTWAVTAYDTSSNSASSTSFNITIDTTNPEITVQQIDDEKNLSFSTQNTALIQEHGPFSIRGPKSVYIEIKTESYATIQTTFKRYSLDENLQTGEFKKQWTNSYKTDHTGTIKISPFLESDQYQLSIISIDRAQNTSALPEITLNITKESIKLPPPISEIIPIDEIIIPPLPSLPATISKIKAEPLSLYPAIAVILFFTIIIITFKYTKKPNLLLLSSQTQKPIQQATIFHSNPEKNGHKHKGIFSFFKTKPEQISFWLAGDDLRTSTLLTSRHTLKKSQNGYLYIPSLEKYSTLTINLQEGKTIILSLSKTPQPEEPINITI